MTETKTPAVQILEQLLATNTLAPQHETHIAEIRGYGWYKTTLNEHGEDKAEAELADHIRRNRFADFASGIEKIARGMLALAQTDTVSEFTDAINVTDKTWYPHKRFPTSTPMVVVLNPGDPGFCCGQLTETQEFGPGGLLGLQAVTLHASIDFRKAQMGLVLPARTMHADNSAGNAFIVAAIELDGTTQGEIRTSRKNFELLQYSLGLADPNWLIRGVSGGGGLSDHFIGFPGATNYLADALPRIGNYFVKLAEKRREKHQH